jgi:hypothetical protein
VVGGTLYGVRDATESLDVSNPKKQSTDAAVREIRRHIRRMHFLED